MVQPHPLPHVNFRRALDLGWIEWIDVKKRGILLDVSLTDFKLATDLSRVQALVHSDCQGR